MQIPHKLLQSPPFLPVMVLGNHRPRIVVVVKVVVIESHSLLLHKSDSTWLSGFVVNNLNPTGCWAVTWLANRSGLTLFSTKGVGIKTLFFMH